jgi:hypothetical protein
VEIESHLVSYTQLGLWSFVSDLETKNLASRALYLAAQDDILRPQNRGFPRYFVTCILIFLENALRGSFTVMMYSFDFGAGGRLDIGHELGVRSTSPVRVKSVGRIPVSSTSSIANFQTFSCQVRATHQFLWNFM